MSDRRHCFYCGKRLKSAGWVGRYDHCRGCGRLQPWKDPENTANKPMPVKPEDSFFYKARVIWHALTHIYYT